MSGRQWNYLQSRQQQYIKVMTSYLDVILADLEYTRDNEAMATAYVRMDRARDRHELGQLSEIELLKTESLYQKIRQQRATSEARQRATRSRLAIALNRPGDLPANLEPPNKPVMELGDMDVNQITAAVLESNPGLKALRAELAAAEQTLKHASTPLRAGDSWRVGGKGVLPGNPLHRSFFGGRGAGGSSLYRRAI